MEESVKKNLNGESITDAAQTIAGIELINMIKKQQLNFTKYID